MPMVQVSKKVITTGLVGALGVVATTQVPDVQAAVRGAVNLAPDSEHVTQFQSVTNFIQEVASGQKHGKVTTKSDVLREKGSKKSADRKSTRLNSSHVSISYAVFCLKEKNRRESILID